MSKKVEGQCRLCLQHGSLTYEHVPPRSSFNKTTRFQSVSFMDIMGLKDPFEEKIKGKIYQGGVGYHSYCLNCNNFLGLEYVNAYKQWSHAGAYAISQAEFDSCSFEVPNILPNEILKHVISMFIAINDINYGKAHPELLEFVKNPDSTELDSKYRIFTYFKKKGQIRYIPFMVTGTLSAGSVVACSEIAFTPYGFVITYDDKKPKPGLVEITRFKEHAPKIPVDIKMNINVFETHLPIPLDYRTKAAIQEGMKNNR
jgi:hypothetical protein